MPLECRIVELIITKQEPMAQRNFSNNYATCWAVVVARLEKPSLPIPEVCYSNPVIGKLVQRTFVYSQLYWKGENKEKEAGKCPKWTFCIVTVHVKIGNKNFQVLLWNFFHDNFLPTTCVKTDRHLVCFLNCFDGHKSLSITFIFSRETLHSEKKPQLDIN